MPSCRSLGFTRKRSLVSPVQKSAHDTPSLRGVIYREAGLDSHISKKKKQQQKKKPAASFFFCLHNQYSFCLLLLYQREVSRPCTAHACTATACECTMLSGRACVWHQVVLVHCVSRFSFFYSKNVSSYRTLFFVAF